MLSPARFDYPRSGDIGAPHTLDADADWTERVACGITTAAPRRPRSDQLRQHCGIQNVYVRIDAV